MDSDSQESINCEDDGEYRFYYIFCDKLCIKRYYNNHLKSKLRRLISIKDNE